MRIMTLAICLFYCQTAIAQEKPLDRTLKIESAEEDFPRAIAKNKQNIVFLYHREKDGVGFGSGFVIDRNGIIATAAHVVRKKGNAPFYAVIKEDGKITVRYVFGILFHSTADIALLSVRHQFKSATTPRFSALLPNEKLYSLNFSMGLGYGNHNPLLAEMVLTSGNFLKNEGSRKRMFVTMSLFGGGSGSPVFDRFGRVVGINVRVAREQQGIHPFTIIEPVHYVRSLFSLQKFLPKVLPR